MINMILSQRAIATRWRTYLQGIAVIVAVEVALHSFIVKEPMVTLLGAVLWLGAGVIWTRKGGNGGPIAVGVLALFEIAATLFATEEFSDGDVATWILVVHVVLVSAALLAAAMTVLEERNTSGSHAASS